MKGAYVYLISFFLAAAAFSQCGQSPNPQGSDTTGNQGGAQGGAPSDTTGNQGQGGAPMDTTGNQGTDTTGGQGGGVLDIQNNDTTGNQGTDTTGGQGNQGQGGQGQMPGDTTGNQNGQGQGNQGQMPSDTTGDQGKAKMLDTVTGIVDSIDTTSSGSNSPMSLTMTNQLGQTTKVILGPQSFLKEMNFSVKKGDSIQVIGSPSQTGGKTTITAYQVRKGQTTLLLRDQNGTPLWSGKGRP